MKQANAKSPQIYSLKLSYKDDLDELQKLVEMFSFQWKMEGRVSNVLRNKLVILLALYMKYGFSRETKDKAVEILQVNMGSINSMNLELRNGNYLVKDKMNTRINHLHPDLTLLKNYIDSLKERGNKQPPLVLFQLIRNNG